MSDAEPHDPVGTPPNVGHEAIRAFFTRIFSGFQTPGRSENSVYVNGNSAAAKWSGHGLAHTGKSAAFESIDVLDCNADGTIVLVRAFWDPAPIMAALQP